MEKVVITGVTGIIGRAVAKQLLENKYTVYGLGRDFSKIPNVVSFSNFIPIKASFPQFTSLTHEIDWRHIDTVYHFAWEGGFARETLSDYQLQIENLRNSCRFIEYAAQTGIKTFIYAATINEVEIQQFINQFERFQTRPTCIYASAKLMTELIGRTIAQKYKMRYMSGVVPMIYGGESTSEQLVNIVLQNLLCGQPPKLIEGNNLYDLVSVNDVAEAFRLIGERGQDGRRYYIGHRELKTFREWITSIRDAVAPQVALKFGEYNDPLNLDYSLIDLNALYEDTGFLCQADFEMEIKQHARWMLEQRKEERE